MIQGADWLRRTLCGLKLYESTFSRPEKYSDLRGHSGGEIISGGEIKTDKKADGSHCQTLPTSGPTDSPTDSPYLDHLQT